MKISVVEALKLRDGKFGVVPAKLRNLGSRVHNPTFNSADYPAIVRTYNPIIITDMVDT